MRSISEKMRAMIQELEETGSFYHYKAFALPVKWYRVFKSGSFPALSNGGTRGLFSDICCEDLVSSCR